MVKKGNNTTVQRGNALARVAADPRTVAQIRSRPRPVAVESAVAPPSSAPCSTAPTVECDVTSCDVLSRRGVHRSRSAIVFTMKGLKKSFVRMPVRLLARCVHFLCTAQEDFPGLCVRKVKGLQITASSRLCPPTSTPKHRQASPPARPCCPRSAQRIRQQQHQPFPPVPTTGLIQPRPATRFSPVIRP